MILYRCDRCGRDSADSRFITSMVISDAPPAYDLCPSCVTVIRLEIEKHEP